MAQFCAAATGPPGRLAWSIIPPPLTAALAAIGEGALGGGAPRHLTPLIERTFRYAYMMATKMRAEMLAAGRGEELEAQIADARALQDDLLEIKRAEGSVEERGGTSS